MDPAPPIGEWWKTFQDDRLDRLVEQGIRRNWDLKAASARVEAAAAQARVVHADLLPQVGAGFSGSRRRQNFIGLPIPGGDERVLSTSSTTLGLSLDISWEADLWGRLSAAESAALAELDATSQDLRGARQSLAAQISKIWFAAIEARQQIRLAEETVDSYRITADRIRTRYLRGLQPSLDLRLALSSLASAEALLEQRRVQLDGAVRQLEVLLGEYPSGTRESMEELPDLPPLPPAGLPAEIVRRRPDILAAERRLLAADARWEQSRKALYPRLTLTTSGGLSTRELLDLLDGDFFVWSLVGNLAQPVFEGGRLRAQVELSDARSREALSLFANATLRAFSEVESALAVERFLAEREKALEAASRQSIASERLARDRYSEGLEQIVTVLEAQRRSLTAQSELITVRRERLDTRVDLHLALGGGFEADPPALKEGES